MLPPGTGLKFLLSTGLLLSTLLFLAAAPVLADSDGYYCAGRGYLAYQFSGLSTATDGHTLYLIELDPEKGFSKPRQFGLEPFQVHGMRCLGDAVDLLAWDRIYRIDLNEGEPSPVDQVEPQPEDSILPDFTSENLGSWAVASRVIPLKTDPGRYSFDLVIEQQTAPQSSEPGLIRQQIRSYIRQKDARGTGTEQEVFTGCREETVD